MENTNFTTAVYPKTMFFMNKHYVVNNFTEEQGVINMIKQRTGELRG